MKNLFFALMATAWLASCSPAPKSVIPDSWRSGAGDEPLDPAASEAIENQVGRFLDLNTQAIETGGAATLASKTGTVPWHLEYFMTDLSVSASGVLGALISKGTPGVSFIWRRQYDRAQAGGATPGHGPGADIEILSGKDAPDVSTQLEPVIHSLVKAGIPEKTLREELLRVAGDFTKVTTALERTPGNQWWASRFRMDVVIEASGVVSPILTAGGEVRLRFEWHRVMPKTKMAAAGPNDELEVFIEGLERDVADAAMGAHELRDAGFEPYQFRVGVGYTEKGSIGIAKEQGTVIGQLYFSRDVKKPTVHPSPSPLASKEDPSVFKKGLERAFKIAAVFARGARTSESRAKPSRHWKVFEMRTAFDVSLTEKLGLAEVGGVGTTEVNFYNENF